MLSHHANDRENSWRLRIDSQDSLDNQDLNNNQPTVRIDDHDQDHILSCSPLSSRKRGIGRVKSITSLPPTRLPCRCHFDIGNDQKNDAIDVT